MFKKTKAAIYIRVSTEDQSPQNQERILVEYCRHHDFDIFQMYVDYGESGLKESRPAFNELLEDMRSRKFNTIVIWKLDRIGRSLQHLLQLLQEIQHKKIDLIVTSQNLDTTTSTGRLMFQIVGAFAEFESSLISERTKIGMERARRIGKCVGRPRKDPSIYDHYCIVDGCRVRIKFDKRFCAKHEKLGNILQKKEGI